jgi:hypothetical protein
MSFKARHMPLKQLVIKAIVKNKDIKIKRRIRKSRKTIEYSKKKKKKKRLRI